MSKEMVKEKRGEKNQRKKKERKNIISILKNRGWG